LFAEFLSVPSSGIGSSAELGMPLNEHFLPRNNGNRSESTVFRGIFSERNFVPNLIWVGRETSWEKDELGEGWLRKGCERREMKLLGDWEEVREKKGEEWGERDKKGRGK
jgi:hypothetical protein